MSRILDTIGGPADLKRLTNPELSALAQEIREEITTTVAHTGGHLGASLGTVELTIALHRVFASPEDKIIWDVGHQTYPHKLLTGRLGQFGTLRQHGGLAGFPKPRESAHDPFGTGHSSTSISAAMGFARARDLDGGTYSVVAVIGDGAMTGGMAWEALNDAGREETRFTIVLNDNGMSISNNVGAMAEYLSRIRTGPAYYRAKEDVETFLRRVPAVGERLAGWARRIKSSLKYLVVPGVLFEELGFTYIGPVDGHDIRTLENVLRLAERTPGPSLVHVVTLKGKGYAPAEREPDNFHGPGPFDVDTGEPLLPPARPSWSSVFGKQLLDIASQDERIIAVVAAMADGCGLGAFADQLNDRFFDVGIAEQHAVTFAAGLAAAGKRPVVALYSTFLQRAYDQVNHDVCIQKLPVVFAVDRAGLVGEDGETHQGVFDLGFLLPLPGLRIMAPSSAQALREMLSLALSLDGPSVVRYPRGQVPEEVPCQPVVNGKAAVLREGRDLTILAVGHMLPQCAEACQDLVASGVDAGLVDLRFLKPLDWIAISECVHSSGAILVVEEGSVIGGVGSYVLSELSRTGLLPRVVFDQIGIPDRYIEHGSTSLLRADLGLTSTGIAARARALLARKSQS